jgi:enoyl-CoA hydratase
VTVTNSGAVMFGPVRYRRTGRVAVISICRPEVRNAVNGPVAEGIETAIDEVEGDDGVWVSVLTGEASCFCSGSDLKAIAAGDVTSMVTERGGFAGVTGRRRVKPLVAAVEGAAFAGGCEIALACDLIVAARNAMFSIPEVKRSLVAAAGGLFRLPAALPRNVALELILTGDPIDAERAHQFGMVNILTDPGKALDGAIALAERICQNGPLAVRASRRVVLDTLDADEDEAFRISVAAAESLYDTEDFREGPLAFLEKRTPRFTGR